jgi:hypothetical protein
MKTRTLSSTAAIVLLAVLAILVYLPAKAQQAGEKVNQSLQPHRPRRPWKSISAGCWRVYPERGAMCFRPPPLLPWVAVRGARQSSFL